MKTIIEPLEGNKVKLSVEVDREEFDRALESAYKRISREVRVPGFRPGKVPRRVLEARIGVDAARQEALREALPGYYAQAVKDQDVDVIAPPDIEVTSDGADGPLVFEAVVETRPTVGIPGYGGLQVTLPALEVDEADVDAQVDRLRDTFAELKDVDRPAVDKDHVTIDISGSRDGQPVEGLSTEDFLYEVGSGAVVPALDENLRGAKTGDILQFDADLGAGAGGQEGPVQLRVLVKGVKEKLLPEVTDEWAAEASEFPTVAELRADIGNRLEVVRRVQARMALREEALSALVGLVAEEVPEALVSAEMERRLHDLGHRLEHQGANIAQYLEAIGRTQDEFVSELRESAVESVKADLALRALAEAEEVEVSEEDVDTEVAALAERYGTPPDRLRRELEQSDQMAALRSDLRKGKALAWLLDHVQTVDGEGRPVDRSLLEDPSEESEATTGEAAAVTGPAQESEAGDAGPGAATAEVTT